MTTIPSSRIFSSIASTDRAIYTMELAGSGSALRRKNGQSPPDANIAAASQNATTVPRDMDLLAIIVSPHEQSSIRKASSIRTTHPKGKIGAIVSILQPIPDTREETRLHPQR
jgi:hypothetical protein